MNEYVNNEGVMAQVFEPGSVPHWTIILSYGGKYEIVHTKNNPNNDFADWEKVNHLEEITMDNSQTDLMLQNEGIKAELAEVKRDIADMNIPGFKQELRYLTEDLEDLESRVSTVEYRRQEDETNVVEKRDVENVEEDVKVLEDKMLELDAKIDDFTTSIEALRTDIDVIFARLNESSAPANHRETEDHAQERYNEAFKKWWPSAEKKYGERIASSVFAAFYFVANEAWKEAWKEARK